MHIILGLLGAIITILILLTRLSDAGIDIGWLDPFKWQRRRQWKKKLQAKPVNLVKDPMEATACLMYAAAKISGEISIEEKNYLLQCFQNDFFLSDKEASSLLKGCSFRVKDPAEILKNIPRFFENNINSYSQSQIDSTIELINKVASLGGTPSETQTEFINAITEYLKPKNLKTQWQ